MSKKHAGPRGDSRPVRRPDAASERPPVPRQMPSRPDRRADRSELAPRTTASADLPAPVEIVTPGGPALIRPAAEADLPALVAFEIEIARISFPRDAITDPAVHEKKLRKALERSEPGMFVLERDGRVLGWLWATFNTNFLTDEQYATFRSLAVDETAPDHGVLADALFSYGIGYAREAGMLEITGKVHVRNTPMRLLYKKAGFEAEHLTMKLPLTDA